ncbi:Mg2+ and Co2+ transporter [Paramagnetospirillum kuznetsovii]|uniref:Magnesium transport protein CorA n=2 Tax=Paramagnetospirillum kuznetsovii TaxID=2053833 RepID=A0A364P2J3_9PROT|nr:Mg2+ and Co2+ transporter [Paramagnetospirillum kuznetsovii]
MWIDMLSPTAEETARVEGLTGIHIPPHEKMQEIEASSRLFRRGGALVATVPILTGSGGSEPRNSVVTFAFNGRQLVTVRYDTPRAFGSYGALLGECGEPLASAGDALLGLIEAVVDRIADVLEGLVGDLDAVSHRIFHQHARDRRRRRATSRELETLLRTIGRAGDLSSRARETILGVKRMIAFMPHGDAEIGVAAAATRLETIGHDVQSLAEHIDFMSNKINFLLDATLGMIGIQQNQIIKLFTIMSVLFLPPTLVGSWYGMNFRVMPELQWDYGYVYATILAVLSALVPYWVFKRKGWM